ncbi:hypothetical protein AB0J86_03655 [Micromonospora sp. NPDC049559]|uniref:hypothetical protein n=1 Tax=Micromonospora sp. NPDC049559 TaxID=3155923 RepID=UPI003438A252
MRAATAAPVTAALAGAAALSVAMAATRRDHGLGLAPAWAWVLTSLQVSALFAAGRGQRTGWLFGASIQVCWITYAVLTSQYGFVPGCLVSLVVQGYSYRRAVRSPAGEASRADRAEQGREFEPGNTAG